MFETLRREPGGVLAADVASHTSGLSNLWQQRHRYPLDQVPAVRLGDALVPAISPAFPPLSARFTRSSFYQFVAPESLLQEFTKRVSLFLAARIYNIARTTQRDPLDFQMRQAPSTLPGMVVEVHSNNHGFVVDASPLYAHQFNYFGAPTSPAYGVLAPGLYAFRGRHATKIITDRGSYMIGHNTSVHVTAF